MAETGAGKDAFFRKKAGMGKADRGGVSLGRATMGKPHSGEDAIRKWEDKTGRRVDEPTPMAREIRRRTDARSGNQKGGK